MKRVLVGFDGSEGAENALNKAMMILDDDGELIIIAIIPLPSDRNLLDQKTYEIIKLRAHNLINSVIHDIGSHGYTITGMVKEGEDIAALIIDVANELRCDLIVLGSRGSSSLGKYPIGSVANKVVQYAAKPVMVVR
ncbi:MAG: universal stress protein [Thermoplasmata archaeon]|nr:universal stress protein [Thermoplasmata archaeon]MBE3137223.1 universal stress protein [Thermoplasmata archaeon]MBE3142134.1 universal stress protein [Thermoplasmata archaeon]